MAQQPGSRGDSPPPTTPGKPVEHGSRQQRQHEPSPEKDRAHSAEEKQPASGPTPPGPK
jgi:hypothetical protein